MATFQRPDRETARSRMAQLVDRYAELHDTVSLAASPYAETEVRMQFIDPMLELLGWDVRNAAGKSPSLSDVVAERTHGAATDTWGRPDYKLRLEGADVIPVEAKRPKVQIDGNNEAANQARSYGWTLSLPMSVLTNFAETIIFSTVDVPDHELTADFGIMPNAHWTYDMYVDHFDEIWDHLSYETANSKRFEELYGKTRDKRGTSQFDLTFLRVFRKWRKALAEGIFATNPKLPARELASRTQKVLNSLLFMRVCEDRNILTYRALLASADTNKILSTFRDKDRIFNAGIFRALDGITEPTQTLSDVIHEMYWPSSKFAFGVMSPEILAYIYEQYLSEQVVIDDGVIDLRERPETIHAGGIARTPNPIVRKLVRTSIDDQFSRGTRDPKVIDLATGSGVFLLEAFNYFVELAETANGGALTLAERAQIAQDRLYGIDIDGASIEVARLSLLLAILGDDHIDADKSIHLLPDLHNNLIVGNSIVGADFDDLQSDDAAEIETRAAVAPLDLAASIGAGSKTPKFDVIVSNPPYISIQTLAAYYPAQLRYLQDPRSGYKSAQFGSFDTYMIFIERAFSLLTSTGSLAFIVPNRFTSALPAGHIRKLLAPRLSTLIDFGEEQVFPERSTYTALLFCGPVTTEPLDVRRVTNLKEWYEEETAQNSFTFPRAELTEAPWHLTGDSQRALFGAMRKNSTVNLGGKEGAAKIFVGVQSSADETFFLKRVRDSANDVANVTFRDDRDREWEIERAILRPCLKDVSIATLDGQPTPDRWAIFPYTIETPIDPKSGQPKRKRARLLSRTELETNYPLALAYLDANRDVLEARSISPDPGESFWAYGRSQSLTYLDDPKLIVRVLSTSPSYAYDSDGLVIPGGGDGGPYYLIRPYDDSGYSSELIQAILSHPAVDLLVTTSGKKYRGSYAVHRKAFLETVPLPPLAELDIPLITKSVRECRDIAVRLRTELDGTIIESLNDRRQHLVSTLMQQISDAYGLDDDQLRSAGITYDL